MSIKGEISRVIGRMENVEEIASWTQQEVLTMQVREASRQLRVPLNNVSPAARGEAELYVQAWARRSSLTISSVEAQLVQSSVIAILTFASMADRAKAFELINVHGSLAIADQRCRAQRATPAFRQGANRPLKEA